MISRRAEHKTREKYEGEGWDVLMNGWPDLLCFRKVNGKVQVRAVESKGDGDFLRSNQRRLHDVLRQAGIEVIVDYPDAVTLGPVKTETPNRSSAGRVTINLTGAIPVRTSGIYSRPELEPVNELARRVLNYADTLELAPDEWRVMTKDEMRAAWQQESTLRQMTADQAKRRADLQRRRRELLRYCEAVESTDLDWMTQQLEADLVERANLMEGTR